LKVVSATSEQAEEIITKVKAEEKTASRDLINQHDALQNHLLNREEGTLL